MSDADKPVANCNCKQEFDARLAYQELARDFTRLVDAVVELGQPPQAAHGLMAHSPAGRAVADPIRSALRIVGGKVTAEFPSCCCVGDGSSWYCSGVLVAPDVVLTAAHCGGDIRRAFIGGTSIEDLATGEVLDVQHVAVHPHYQPATHANDISLLVLASASRTEPTPIATREEILVAGLVTLVGFGYNDPVRPVGFGTKRKVTESISALPRPPSEDEPRPEEATHGFDARAEFVAGRKFLGRDTCNGDSGGPAYVATNDGYKVGGLTSRATNDRVKPCGDGGIYVMPDAHREWINRTLQALGKQPLA
ncbi:S1 family peptidase [Sorangium sp. So ce341]|uniref:S1 family peptidase n=1 Tax=Sorangium sp. So ce341 TaxID=3133302 RepID=UPI003F62DA86